MNTTAGPPIIAHRFGNMVRLRLCRIRCAASSKRHDLQEWFLLDSSMLLARHPILLITICYLRITSIIVGLATLDSSSGYQPRHKPWNMARYRLRQPPA